MTENDLFKKALDIIEKVYLDTRTELKIRLEIAKFIKELEDYRENKVEQE